MASKKLSFSDETNVAPFFLIVIFIMFKMEINHQHPIALIFISNITIKLKTIQLNSIHIVSLIAWIKIARPVHVLVFFSCILIGLQADLAPVPLSIFRSNSKFDENSKHSSVTYTPPITAIFCTRHDSTTVVTCAKYRCDWSNRFETRAFWILIEYRIRSKYA